jgi:major intracellular serine protease
MMKCFCEARRTQSYFTKCLNEQATLEERELLIEIVQEYTKTSNKLRDFCENKLNDSV